MLALPEQLRKRLLEVREVLMFTFDFELLEQPLDAEAYATPSPWLPAFVVPNAQTSVVGRDATGGVYLACQRSDGQTRCLHIDTLGHAVPLGENLEQLLGLLVALPYWRELLLGCASGDLTEMRALAERLELEVCDDLPALPSARTDLLTFLELPEFSDPVARLHQLAVLDSELVSVMSPHGWQYASPITQVSVHAE